MLFEFCKISESPPDGHCFLHSMVTSLKAQLRPIIIRDTNQLLDHIDTEVSRHFNQYMNFIVDNDEHAFREGLQKYASDKQYDRDSVDQIPLIVCNALNITLIIIDDTLNSVTDVQPLFNTKPPTVSIVLHKIGDHYNGVISNSTEPL